MNMEAIVTRSQLERENWHYTDLPKLLKKAPLKGQLRDPSRTYQRIMVSTVEKLCLFFVDGVYQPERSQLGALPSTIMQKESSGYRLELAGQTCLVTSPIELLFTTTGQVQEPEVRLHIELGANGRLSLLERHESSSHNATIVNMSIALQPQAKLVHVKIIAGGNAVHMAQTTVHIAEGGFYNNFALIKGCSLVRNEIEAMLDGKLAQCTLNGVMLLRGHEHADTTTRIIHEAPYGTSREVYKSVLAEQAQGVFQAKIIVKQDAQKTDGYQLSRALLLSDQAEMNVKPELEINADDVKCSHGSTIGDLDANAMFYLRARGLSELESRGVLIKAFVDEILDEIHIPEGHDVCRMEVEEWLNECI